MTKRIIRLFTNKHSNGLNEIKKELLKLNGFNTIFDKISLLKRPDFNSEYLQDSDFDWRAFHINWGSSDYYSSTAHTVQNKISLNEKPVLFINKAVFFKKMSDEYGNGEITPTAFFDANTALEYLKIHTTKRLVARKFLSSHSGNGIYLISYPDIVNNWDEFKDFKLFTLYVPKLREFRIHMFKNPFTGEVRIGWKQEKLLKKDTPIDHMTFKVRTGLKGWVYTSNTILPTNWGFFEQGLLKVFNDFSLDFGAFDIIYNKAGGFFKILEVNTAPGLTPVTAVTYAKNFGLWAKEWFNNA